MRSWSLNPRENLAGCRMLCVAGNLLHCAPDIVESTASQDGHITKLSDFLSLLVQMYNNETSKSCSRFLGSQSALTGAYEESWLRSIQLTNP